MNKKQQILKLQKMCQEYSDLVDRQQENIEMLIAILTTTTTPVLPVKEIDFDKDEDPIQQLAKILVSLSDVDWDTLGSEIRIHLLNDHSDDWMNHGKIASKFSTIESIIDRVAYVEEVRRHGGSF